MFLWGSAIFLCTLVPHDLRWQLWARAAVLRRSAVFSLTLASLLSLPVHTAIIGDGWRDAVRFDMLYSVATETTIGTAWLCQMAGIALLMCLIRASASLVIQGAALTGALLLASLAITGHAAMGEGIYNRLHQANDIIHLLTAGAWLGALPIVLMLLPCLTIPGTASDAKKALMRFSTGGHVVVVTVMLTGIVSTFLILDGLPLDWTYPYQRLLASKILIVVGMALLAIFNRYVLVPRMRRSTSAMRYFYWGTLIEIVLSFTALLLVAWLGMLDPN